ncbi:hypothetical protein ACFV2V_07080 [Streptomyces sp. NPDC059698]|uniref:hypothetical protein n=1 Tax=unclassified Streptomyces TaxID=2593676 RepID=UPI0011611B52|nr:hypothetical protein [Streptomyces sp. CB02366]WSS57147.1 hypothetical protein OG543_18185 [Streptomyces sp. NBC_01178]
MTPFPRPPEWMQPPHRHSVLKDPVLTVRKLSRLGFVPRGLTRIDHALVFSTPAGTYITCLPPLRPSRREAVRRRYTAVHEVDMGVHPLRLKLALPSDNDALQFEAAVELTWQVGDPAVFVASGIRDVPRLLGSELEQAARSVTRGFRVTDSAEAEDAVLRAVRARLRLGAAAGLIVTWTLRLHRDRDSIEHQRRMQGIGHAADERIHREQLGMTEDAETDRRVRRRDELETERALAYGQLRQDVLLRQQQWQTELREGESAKIDFYRKQLEQGGVRAWALHLAERPEDLRLVIQSLREDQVNIIRAKADMVAKLLGGDDAESYELEGPKELALRALNDILNQQLPGATAGQGPGMTLPPVSGVPADLPQQRAEPTAGSPKSRVCDVGAPDATAGMFPDWQPPPGSLTGPAEPSRSAETAPVRSPGQGEVSGVAPAEENLPEEDRR